MTGVEEIIRAAIDQTAEQVKPEDLKPLRLAPGDHRVSLTARPAGELPELDGPGQRKLARPLAAFGAAAALLALIAGSFVVATWLRHDRGEVTTAPKPPVTAAGIPRYYVEITPALTQKYHGPQHAVVIDSTTGRVLATIRPPKPYSTFTAVTAAADDKTFVLVARTFVPTQPARSAVLGAAAKYQLFVLSFRPGKATKLTQLGLDLPVGWSGEGLALSPDGTKLAVAAGPVTKRDFVRVQVYTMATGAIKTWSADGTIGFEPWDARSLSWAPDDRTLAYYWFSLNGGINLLDTRTAGGSLLGHSHRLITLTFSRLEPTADFDLTPNGTRIVAAMLDDRHPRQQSFGIGVYSAVTGRLLAVRGLTGLGSAALYDVLWTNANGSVMIVDLIDYANPRLHNFQILRGSRLSPMPGTFAGQAQDVAW
jgi:hypothetical protein